ncbi:phosphocholine cytidylyltransferase family protein [Candidatus Nitrosacidococcus sp. I8]|uniref:phosphocholine cytidylyltransferase family protein n=1 Tax=Candidatus Nitrosacidococcus sp. I8 TaxID=2942908 RepID=UPI00222800A6|nr:phosphocholine cytidylyltransferase family protein [Candidatus Nitrosacidococcus sp. I8]CAH9017815.1 CTP:phosphoglutamine cytidylyltransferase [Candidatus Nitrosacidococcus sp. I8]
MHAIILAAGQGKRLAGCIEQPKCLLKICESASLLERHLSILEYLGIQKITFGLGYQADKIRKVLGNYSSRIQFNIEYNPYFNQGSVVTLWTLREYLRLKEDILLMDADVLYDYQICQQLLQSPHDNCFLLDRRVDINDEEPVKLCLHHGIPIEFRKNISKNISYDLIGESVGFFRFSAEMASQLADRCQYYIDHQYYDLPYEEAIRDVLLANLQRFGIEDITGLPWIEIDFPEDIIRAQQIILPLIQSTPKAS